MISLNFMDKKHVHNLNTTVPNTYHRAIRGGATFYCVACDEHLTAYGEKVCILCPECKTGFAHIIHVNKQDSVLRDNFSGRKNHYAKLFV